MSYVKKHLISSRQFFLMLLFSIIAVSSSSALAAATLSPGDIAFIGLNTDGKDIGGGVLSQLDDISFVLLKDISVDTEIKFTDCGWIDGSGFFCADLNGDKGHFTWTATSDMSSGEIVRIVTYNGNADPTASSGTISGDRMLIAIQGDQVFAFQGSFDISATLVAGIHYNVQLGDPVTTADNWDNWDGSNVLLGVTASALPDSLTNGINAVWVYAPGPTEQDNLRYNCSVTSGTAETLRLAINDVHNWETSSSLYLEQNPFPCSLTVETLVCDEPTVPVLSAAPSSPQCPGTPTTLNISGTLNDATAWQIYSGSCGGTNIGSTSGATYDVSPTATITYYSRGEGECTTPGSCGTVTVTASDTTDPVISCPADQTVNADSSGQGTLADYTGGGSTTDNCDPDPLMSQFPVPGTTISDTATITLTSTDASSNATSCTFEVAIVDITAPVISGMVIDLSVATDSGADTAVVIWAPPTANDNVDGSVTPVAESSPTTGLDSGSAFPMGTTTITYTATDSSTNTATASFKVTVSDQEAPVISGMVTDISATTDPGADTAVVSWTAPTASDNVDGSVIPVAESSPTTGLDSGSAFPIGTTTITYTATDSAGNTVAASFAIRVVEQDFPWNLLLPGLISPNKVSGEQR